MIKNILNFFKPTWIKSILLILLFLFFPVIFPWLANGCPMYEVYPGMNIEPCYDKDLKISVGFVTTAIYEQFTKPSTWSAVDFEIRSLPPMWYPEYYIYHIIISYILSCLGYSIYNKFKKRK
ncbi:MAG: hypothetical protein WC867_02465 [Candidatus Pacearchaeota archaeon]|jgi:hypothetical protein